MQPNLRECCHPLRKHKGSVRPQDRFEFRQSFNQARNDAGILEDWPDKRVAPQFRVLPLGAFNDAALTALQLGHHDSRVTFAHYRELVKPKEGERYWQLQPAKADKRSSRSMAR
jgi:hypothetical protein